MIVRLLSQDSLAVGAPSPGVPAPAVPEAPRLPAGMRVPDKTPDKAPILAAASAVADKTPPSAAVQPAPPEPGLPPAPAYLAGGRLDPGPRPLEDIDPAYPEEAQQQEGSVVLRLLINEAGTVDNVAIVRAYPVGLFDRSALEAFGKATFSPGKMLGVAVKSQITIEVMFTPINRGAKVSGRSY